MLGCSPPLHPDPSSRRSLAPVVVVVLTDSAQTRSYLIFHVFILRSFIPVYDSATLAVGVAPFNTGISQD